MEMRLKVAENGDNFRKIKKSGFGGVIFPAKLAGEAVFKEAKKQRLKILLHIGDFSRSDCFYLEPDGVFRGEMYAVTVDTVRKTAEKLEGLTPLFDGFVIPAPKLKGLLWQDGFAREYEDFCGRDFREDMPLVFDKYEESADIRMWYYMRAESAFFQGFIMPFKDFGKEICFDFGNAPNGMALIKKQINPYMFLKNKLAVIYENNGEIVLVTGKSRTKELLLVLPVCSVMRNMAWGAQYSRMESPLNTALAEEEYYKIMLKRCGIGFRVADELEFSEMKRKELEKFENILICDSCMIADRDRLKGLNVNDKKLLELLDKGN